MAFLWLFGLKDAMVCMYIPLILKLQDKNARTYVHFVLIHKRSPGGKILIVQCSQCKILEKAKQEGYPFVDQQYWYRMII